VIEDLFRNGIEFPVVEVFTMLLEVKKEGFFSCDCAATSSELPASEIPVIK
jgi:hypothetical protein